MKTMIWLQDFAIDEYEVTKQDWDAIRLWAKEHGYDDLSVGRGKGKQPVGCITWYDAVKFTNALSEFCGLMPVYYDFNGNVYKTGAVDLEESCIQKNANGYRLPFVEEWIYAAKGGTDTPYIWGKNKFPDGLEYACQGLQPEPVYHIEGMPEYFGKYYEITQKVGTKKPNQYGLYDMIGNVYEWCFDKQQDVFRCMMGGSVALDAVLKSEHVTMILPDYKCYETGLRVVSNDKNAKSIGEAAKESPYYGIEEMPKPIYPDMSPAAIADRLYKQLDDSTFSKEIKGLIEKEEYEEAFEKFRDTKLAHIRERYDVSTGGAPKIMRTEEELLQLKDIFDVKFYEGNFKYDVYEGLPELEYFAWRYAETKDKEYMRLYSLILKAYLVRQKAEHDVLSDEQMLEWNDTPMSWAWGNGFNPGKRSLRIMNSLSMLAHAMLPEEYSLLPADIFTELSVSLMGYGMYPTLKDGRVEISNQVSHAANWVVSITGIFDEFKNAALYSEYVLERFVKSLQVILYPDGSSTEQSLSYNQGVIDAYFDLKNRVDQPKKLENLKKEITPLSRMLVSVTPPVNNRPMTAYCGSQTVAPSVNSKDYKSYFEYLTELYRFDRRLPWEEYDRILDLFLHPEGETPKFNSIYFPYGGTSVLREGWRREDRYLYFFAPRAGFGHTAEAVGDIQIYAFGRELIKTGGRKSYNQLMNMRPEQHEMHAEADQYMCSSFSRNTVLVDGCGQSRIAVTEQVRQEKYPDTTGYRWYESEHLVYTEGVYNEAYGEITDCKHKREVLFLKESGLWIILDRMYSEKPHEYTQIWHLPLRGETFKGKINGSYYEWEIDGFSREEILIAENQIKTTQKDAPNVFIRHLEPMTYERHSGEMDPIRGFTSYESSEGFVYYPMEEIYCTFKGEKEKTLITVIEASPNERSAVNAMTSKEGITEFHLTHCVLTICQKDHRVEIMTDQGWSVVLDDRGEYCEIDGGDKHEFRAPLGMQWKEKDGYFYPEYE